MADDVDAQVHELALQAQRWMAASNRLFAAGVVDEEAYVDAVRLIGVVLTHLRAHCATTASLVSEGPAALAVLEQAMKESPPATPFDAQSLLDAARGVRYGEIASLTAPGSVISHN